MAADHPQWNLVEERPLSSSLADELLSLGVMSVSLLALSRAPSLQTRTLDDRALQDLATACREEYDRVGVSFWELMLGALASSEAEVRQRVLKEALYHQPDASSQQMTVNELSRLMTDNDWSASTPDAILAISSAVRVSIDGGSAARHLPMLDFRLKSTDDNHQVALEVLSVLGYSGLLYNSGRSYHYYGDEVVDQAEMWQQLGRAQLLSPIIDQRWVAHQMIAGRCALRVSWDPEHHKEPVLVAVARK